MVKLILSKFPSRFCSLAEFAQVKLGTELKQKKLHRFLDYFFSYEYALTSSSITNASL